MTDENVNMPGDDDEVILDPDAQDPDEAPTIVTGETPAERQLMILAIRKAGPTETLQCAALAGIGPRFPKVCEDRALIAEADGNPARADAFRELKNLRHGTVTGLAQLMMFERECVREAKAAEAAKVEILMEATKAAKAAKAEKAQD